jgi:hypothetical protein
MSERDLLYVRLHTMKTTITYLAFISRCCGLVLALTTAACGPTNNNGDSGPGPSDALVFPEVSVDVPGVRNYFQRCRENADCTGVAPNGARELCDRSFPGGMCRVLTCATSAICGPMGICTRQRGCLPRCDLNSDFCSMYSGMCLSFDLPLNENTACFSVCDSAAPGEPPDTRTPVDMGPRVCRAGLTCDPYLNRCVEMPRTTGLENGAPCRADNQCRSDRCIPEIDTLDGRQATGFLGGYCVSEAPLPSAGAFERALGGFLPRSTCPANSVVLPPTDPMRAPGSAARCMRECMADADCRGGYRCERGRNMMGAPAYRNGGCVPLDCSAPNTQCPAGSRCVASDSDGGVLFTGSRCLSTAPNDGGAGDASSDASRDASMQDGGEADATDSATDATADAADVMGQ